MSENVIQYSFASGEMSPAMLSRVDVAKYRTSATTMVNFFVDYRGGAASTRPGTKFIYKCQATKYSRLITFEYSTVQTFVLVLENQSMRFISNGGVVLSGGVPYTISTPWISNDLLLLKFAQLENKMTFTHPNYPPYELIFSGPTSWTLAPIIIGPLISAPTILTGSPSAGGTASYSYVVTAVNSNGDESVASVPATVTNAVNIVTSAGTIFLSWSPISGAVSYNVYRSQLSIGGAISINAAYGFVGSSNGNEFADSNEITPDFTISPPVFQNPFIVGSVISTTVTTGGTYTTVPTVTFSPSPVTGGTAIGQAILGIATNPPLNSGGTGYKVGDFISLPFGILLEVLTLSGSAVATVGVSVAGAINAGNTPSNPLSQISTSGSGTGYSANPLWGVIGINVSFSGVGYITAPTIAFSSGSAAATTTLGPSYTNNPGVPFYFQQRRVMAASINNPQSFWMSQPGLYYNFDVSDPIQDSDAITGTLVSDKVNQIKSFISTQYGLLAFSSYGAWLINGGGNPATTAITPANASANPEASNGISDVPPIKINQKALFVQALGSFIYELSYNIYVSSYDAQDISIWSNHLFYPYYITEWAYSASPFKIVWAIRNDGDLLSLTYVPEQEIKGFARHTTQGTFISVASVIEGNTDAVYVVVNRGFGQFVERFDNRVLQGNVLNAWCVDCGISGTSSTLQATWAGLDHLDGQTVVGLGDGSVFPPQTVSGGTITLPNPVYQIVAGLAFTPQLQSPYLDIGEPTIQGKRKKLAAVTIRLLETRGLRVGATFNTLVDIKERSSQNVLGAAIPLVTGDERIILDPLWSIQGQVCIEQDYPLPATVLGIIPEVIIGDTIK